MAHIGTHAAARSTIGGFHLAAPAVMGERAVAVRLSGPSRITSLSDSLRLLTQRLSFASLQRSKPCRMIY